MSDALSAFAKGGCGCLGAALLGGVAIATIGGNFRIDLGGAIIVGLMGGGLGLALHSAYERGRHARQLGTPSGADPTHPPPMTPTARPRPFTSRWSADAAISVSDALAHIVEHHWRGESPELRYSGSGSLEVTFLPREHTSPLRLILVADVEADEVVVHFHGPRGEVVMRGGAWRGDAAPNPHLSRVHDFVQDLLEERMAYVFDSTGTHRFVERDDVPKCIASDPDALLRSWDGSLDHGTDA